MEGLVRHASWHVIQARGRVRVAVLDGTSRYGEGEGEGGDEGGWHLEASAARVDESSVEDKVEATAWLVAWVRLVGRRWRRGGVEGGVEGGVDGGVGDGDGEK